MGLAFDYLQKYHNLQLNIPGLPPLTVHLSQYLRGWDTPSMHVGYPMILSGLQKKGIAAALSAQVYCVGDPPYQFTITKQRMAWVFEGKGSPEDIASVLSIGVYCGVLSHPAAKPTSKHHLPTVQEFTDRYLGVDCNGFVSNFIGLANHSTDLGSFNKTSTGGDARRKDPGDLRRHDVLLTYVGVPHHVGVIDEVNLLDPFTGKVLVSVAEWGESGVGNHYGQKWLTLVQDKRSKDVFTSELPTRYLCMPPQRVSPNP